MNQIPGLCRFSFSQGIRCKADRHTYTDIQANKLKPLPPPSRGFDTHVFMECFPRSSSKLLDFTF